MASQTDGKTFRLYDTQTKQVKPLETLEPGVLTFYSCGPTVYSYAHIGNFRTFLTADLIVRTAEALGWTVKYVSNITDVGHLTEDDVADASGEDKMAKALKSKEGQSFANIWDLAEHYSRALEEDWNRLNLRQPMVRPRATQHMAEQIRAIEDLQQSGHAYSTDSAVYFDLSTFPRRGELSGNRDDDSLQVGVRDVVQDRSKRHPFDFALWKRDDRHLMQWYSPWGWGFPGWHIECSVMAMKYLGETIDLHAGGEDLVFPHHECEIAQSESLTGKPFANHWIHTRFLQVEGKKMSKSEGNYFTVRGLIDERGVDPPALRYALISVPYGKPLNFTLQSLKDAAAAVQRYRRCDELSQESTDETEDPEVSGYLNDLYDEALEAMCNDLNTSVALAKAFEGTRVILKAADGSKGGWARPARLFLDRIDALLGIVRPNPDALTPAEKEGAAEDFGWIEDAIAARAEAKKGKDFTRADAIRQELWDKGIELQDTVDGTKWQRRLMPIEAESQ